MVDAQRAISRLNGFVIMGRRIRVKMARFSGNRNREKGSGKERFKPKGGDVVERVGEPGKGKGRTKWQSTKWAVKFKG